MNVSNGGVRVALIAALALGLMQGCAWLPNRAAAANGADSEAIVKDMYKRDMYITGSRIPRRVDARKSAAEISTAPMRVIKVVR
jgi:hypothetical protein